MIPEHESNRVEFKTILNDRFERSVVAFLNAMDGGELYAGVADDGSVIGIENVDDVQLRIYERIQTNICPAALGLVDIGVETVAGKNILHLSISEGLEKPYYIKRYGMSEKGCFIRSGSAVIPMTTRMIERCLMKRSRINLKQLPAPSQRLSFEQLRIFYLEHGHALNDSFADNLDFLTDDGMYNWLAYLLADNNHITFPFAKYAGTDKVELMMNKECGFCSLIRVADRLLEQIGNTNETFTKITSKYRQEKQRFDLEAVREILINALVHNDYTYEMTPIVEVYSDRLTITSYGGLPLDLSKEEMFKGRSVRRNPELMRIFKDVELVEQLGSGMQRILKSYGPEIFDISDNFVCVTIPFAKNDFTYDEAVNEAVNEREILYYIARHPRCNTKQLLAVFPYSRSTIQRKLSQLKDDGCVEFIGAAKNGGYVVKK